MLSKSRCFTLPDLLATCPLQDAVNPYYEKAAAESRAWINSYNILPDRKRAFVIQECTELLCSHVYAYAGAEQLRTACDFVNLLFVVDEVSDVQNGKDAHATGRIFSNVMSDPKWDDGSVLAKITREFRERFCRLAGPKNTIRFIELCKDYTTCVGVEAELREEGRVLGMKAFTHLRRNNSAVLLCFSLIEYILGVDLADEIYTDSIFMDAYNAACDHVCWANDVYSYDREQSQGHTGNNIVTVLMQEKGVTIQEASDIVGERCNEFVQRYISSKALLVDRGFKRYSPEMRVLDAMGQWMIGNLVWSFETVRYFGARHLDIKDSLVVCLRPKEIPEDIDSESDSD